MREQVSSDSNTDEDLHEDIIEPFDPTLIRVTSRHLTIHQILTRIFHNEIDLTPDFQRRVVWNDDAQSRLVESVLIRIPLPAFYMDGTDDDRWLVVDGLQRLSALKRFVLDNDLKLSGLEFLTQFTGKRYKELPRSFQRRIDETQVTAFIIEEDTPPNVKFNIFKRINTGGEPLSAQEIRHALNQGPATRLLAELAESFEFRVATARGVDSKRMADREMVLRFCAFALARVDAYRDSDLDRFLNEAMRKINCMEESERQSLIQRFKRAMIAATKVFGQDAFRKRYDRRNYRSPINRALFEAWAVNFDLLSNPDLQYVVSQPERVRDAFVKLMHDPAFDAAISQGTSDAKKVRLRFKAISNLLENILRDRPANS